MKITIYGWSTSRLAGEVLSAGRLLVHVAAATAHAERLGAAPLLSVNVLNKVAARLMDAGQLDTARPLLDRALHIAPVQLGPDHPDTLTARNNLASWLVLRVVQGEHSGVIGGEYVLMLKSPARRSRAGLGVQGVAGMLSLSR